MAKKRATRRRGLPKTSDPKDRDKRVTRPGLHVWIVYYNQKAMQWRVYKSIARRTHFLFMTTATISVNGQKIKLNLKSERDRSYLCTFGDTIDHFAQRKNAIAEAISRNRQNAKESRRLIKYHEAVVAASKEAVADLSSLT